MFALSLNLKAPFLLCIWNEIYPYFSPNSSLFQYLSILLISPFLLNIGENACGPRMHAVPECMRSHNACGPRMPAYYLLFPLATCSLRLPIFTIAIVAHKFFSFSVRNYCPVQPFSIGSRCFTRQYQQKTWTLF